MTSRALRSLRTAASGILLIVSSACVLPGTFDAEDQACAEPKFDSTLRPTFCSGAYTVTDVFAAEAPQSGARTLLDAASENALQFTPDEPLRLWSFRAGTETSLLPLENTPLSFAANGAGATVLYSDGTIETVGSGSRAEIPVPDGDRCEGDMSGRVHRVDSLTLVATRCGILLLNEQTPVAVHELGVAAIVTDNKGRILTAAGSEVRQTSVATILDAPTGADGLPRNQDRGQLVATFEGDVVALALSGEQLAVVAQGETQNHLHLGRLVDGVFEEQASVELADNADSLPTFEVQLLGELVVVLRRTQRVEFTNVRLGLYDAVGGQIAEVEDVLPVVTNVWGIAGAENSLFVGLSDRVVRYDLQIR